MDVKNIEAELSKTIDNTLAQQLIQEFVKIEETFILKKWQYTELNGGRFSEVASRIVYSVDSGNLSLTKSVDNCLKYIDNDSVTHSFPEAQTARHMAKVLRSVYKLRSQRGAVHVSPTYTANEIDSRLVIESVRWLMAEVLRVFITADLVIVERTLRDLARFPYPIIRLYDGTPFVQAINLSTEEEILAQLLYNGEALSTLELTKLVHRDQAGIRRAVLKLAGSKVREITGSKSAWHITDLGIKRIEAKLTVL
jgi:hypothetical protein